MVSHQFRTGYSLSVSGTNIESADVDGYINSIPTAEASQTVTGVNFFTHEAIFILSYKNFEPIKIKSSKKVFAKNSVIAN